MQMLASCIHRLFQWDIERSASLSTFTGHEHVLYSAVWSPLVPGCFATVSGTVDPPPPPGTVEPHHSQYSMWST